MQLSYSGTPASLRRIREHVQENRCPTAFSSDDQWLRDMNGHDETYQAQTSHQRSFTAVPVANTTTMPPMPAGILISKSSPTTASACNARARSLISSVA